MSTTRPDNIDYIGVREISKRYGGIRALTNVSLRFNRGEVHALLGANGAGKSTLVRILSGAIAPDSGSILIGDESTEELSPRDAHDFGIRTIFQEFTLVPQLSAADNIMLGKEKTGRFFLDRVGTIEEVEELFNELGADIDPHAEVRVLSVAQQQQVEIAKALAGGGVRLLIMDEPTSGLTRREADQLFDIVRNLKSRGVGVVFITHRMAEAQQLADRATVLRDGKLIGTVDIEQTSKSDLARMIVGPEFSGLDADPQQVRLRARVGVGEEVLTLEDVSNEYLKHLNFSLHSGQVLGVFGLVGSGRTRLARLIFGVDPARTGQIRLRGKIVDIASPAEAVGLGIAMLPENRKAAGLFMSMSTIHNATITSLEHLTNSVGLVDNKDEAAAFGELQDSLLIQASSPSIPVKALSGGNQQKICLGRWLLTDSDVLILDEPTRGVDIASKSEIYEFVHSLADAGKAVLVLSSEESEITSLTNECLVMIDGWIIKKMNIGPGDEPELLLAAGGQK